MAWLVTAHGKTVLSLCRCYLWLTNQRCVSWPRNKSWGIGWIGHYHYFNIYAIGSAAQARWLNTERRGRSWAPGRGAFPGTVAPPRRLCPGRAPGLGEWGTVTGAALLSVFNQLETHKEPSGSLSHSLVLPLSLWLALSWIGIITVRGQCC